MTYSIPEGSNVTLSERNRLVANWVNAVIDVEWGEERKKTDLCEKRTTFSVSGHQETLKVAHAPQYR